ncbi:MAG: hypothetical protein JW938_05845 [Candidatus Omnitrophica bacterium]|nr:hypothetical protein [Candidatus Omnitrophota bacterium]
MKLKTKVIVGVRIAWLTTITLIILDEILDMPALFFNAPATPVNFNELLLEIACILIVALFIERYLTMLFGRIKYLEGFHKICAYCKSVQVDETWVPVEHFLDARSDMTVSHGFCNTCLKKNEPELYERLKKKGLVD